MRRIDRGLIFGAALAVAVALLACGHDEVELAPIDEVGEQLPPQQQATTPPGAVETTPPADRELSDPRGDLAKPLPPPPPDGAIRLLGVNPGGFERFELSIEALTVTARAQPAAFTPAASWVDLAGPGVYLLGSAGALPDADELEVTIYWSRTGTVDDGSGAATLDAALPPTVIGIPAEALEPGRALDIFVDLQRSAEPSVGGWVFLPNLTYQY